MTFKELLDSVTFKDVEEHLRKMYPAKRSLTSMGWYKIHFDMLRQLTPKHDDDANDDVCHITMKKNDNGRGLHLDAYPMEGDLWEHSLTKELIIAPDVKATNAEIAACCLWHTSFYGFVEEQTREYLRTDNLDIELMDRWDNAIYYGKRASMNFNIIREHGGEIPIVKDLTSEKKRRLLGELKNSRYDYKRLNPRCALKKNNAGQYYKRMTAISDFIVKAIPAINDKTNDNYIDVEQLCYLFQSDIFFSEEITSYADEGTSGAKYLLYLILIYDMLPHFDRMVYIITTGEPFEKMKDEALALDTEDYLALENVPMGNCKSGDVIFATDPSLGHQVRINYATFNSRYPLTR